MPVGAFLSGGLDSTLIASYAAKTLGSELRTFSMGIPYRDLNELPYAAAVAARYGTQHYAEEVTPSVVDDLPRLVSALDEPADPLSICLLHLARMTARAREGGARRRRRRRAVRRLRPLRGRSLAR